MKKSFFLESSFKSDRGNPTTPYCGLCGLYKNCLNPKMKPVGKGSKKILIVGEAPGKEEDRYGKPFIGSSLNLLKRTLRKMGVDLYSDCWRTNAVICRRIKNTQPDDKKIEACRPNLLKTIRDLQPNVIILLGVVATKSLIPVIFKSGVDRISRWGGYYIPCHDPNAWIISTFHPSHVLKDKNPVVKIEFEKHIRGAIKRAKKRPWEIVPDYKSQVEMGLKWDYDNAFHNSWVFFQRRSTENKYQGEPFDFLFPRRFHFNFVLFLLVFWNRFDSPGKNKDSN